MTALLDQDLTPFNDATVLATPRLSLPPLETGEGVDTWYRVGDWDTDEERTVTVVFRRDPLDQCDPLQEAETGEFAMQPFPPLLVSHAVGVMFQQIG